MEKLGILRWRDANATPDTDDLLAAADRLCRAGHWVTAYIEHTGPAAAFRYGDDPTGGVLSSGLTVWVDSVDQRHTIVDQLPAALKTSLYLLTESVPLAYADRTWPDGLASPGVNLMTVFPRIADLDDETFFARWHGSHSALTYQIHPIQRYVRNTVTRSLDGALPADSLVTESFALDDLMDPSRFYGVAEPDIGWRDAMATINEDLVTFCDMTRLQTAPTEEIMLASAPWER